MSEIYKNIINNKKDQWAGGQIKKLLSNFPESTIKQFKDYAIANFDNEDHDFSELPLEEITDFEVLIKMLNREFFKERKPEVYFKILIESLNKFTGPKFKSYNYLLSETIILLGDNNKFTKNIKLRINKNKREWIANIFLYDLFNYLESKSINELYEQIESEWEKGERYLRLKTKEEKPEIVADKPSILKPEIKPAKQEIKPVKDKTYYNYNDEPNEYFDNLIKEQEKTAKQEKSEKTAKQEKEEDEYEYADKFYDDLDNEKQRIENVEADAKLEDDIHKLIFDNISNITHNKPLELSQLHRIREEDRDKIHQYVSNHLQKTGDENMVSTYEVIEEFLDKPETQKILNGKVLNDREKSKKVSAMLYDTIESTIKFLGVPLNKILPKSIKEKMTNNLEKLILPFITGGFLSGPFVPVLSCFIGISFMVNCGIAELTTPILLYNLGRNIHTHILEDGEGKPILKHVAEVGEDYKKSLLGGFHKYIF